MSLLKKIIVFFLAAFVLILGIWFAIVWHRLIYTPLLNKGQLQSTSIKVPPRTGIHYLADQLHQEGYIYYPKLFILLAKINGEAYRLKAGEYRINPGITAPELLANMIAGKVMQRSILFVEGWTFRQYRKALNANPNIKHTTETLTDAELMEKLGYPNEHPEGLFFPDTYFFTWGDSDLTILREAYDAMKKVLAEAWDGRASTLSHQTAYEALIVASLIEKETALPRERPLISGVIMRRLQKGMRLQVDPTVVYGLGQPYGSKITKEDLESDTPYNTYRRYGLPPTPIDMPSQASIIAAMHPDHGDALYYVSRGDGSHQFSVTYKEHFRAVEKYLRPEAHKICFQSVIPALNIPAIPTWIEYCEIHFSLTPCSEKFYGK